MLLHLYDLYLKCVRHSVFLTLLFTNAGGPHGKELHHYNNGVCDVAKLFLINVCYFSKN